MKIIANKSGAKQKVTVDPDLKSHRSDPFVVKKVEEAKQTIARLRKAGFNLF
ncbi:hypothetical protein [Dyadobacter aurulentus]|uniref:hypothetical protein n=1 Tax=Dyadobacter sp. UC 10 TaxID=2605428 RepID=UPI001788BAAD|nr:hypothetical protein [Dyadobacter sp. UC 10]